MTSTSQPNSLEELIKKLPKAELHIHIEGSFEPELMLTIAERNGVILPYPNIEAIREAYNFSDLQSFLDIYYEGAKVLIYEQDFYDLTWAYLTRVSEDNVRHVELFFDPQTHTDRGIAFETVIQGIHRALVRAESELSMTSRMIMCFLRHLSAKEAMETLEHALPFKDKIIAVGLDSSEKGNPPEKFKIVFDKARAEGFLTVAHAGEEGPPEYIWQAIEQLKVARVDHGVRCVEDKKLVEYLVQKRLPLTVCPLSNVKLCVFPHLREHNLKSLLQQGVCITLNSDDPAYFGGYMTKNYMETSKALSLTAEEIVQLAKNSIEASFLEPVEKEALFLEIETISKAWRLSASLN